MHEGDAYGAWGLAIAMIIVSVFFVFRFLPMRTRLGKRSGGALIAFLVALFAEMYGFPLTIWLLGRRSAAASGAGSAASSHDAPEPDA